MKFNLKKVCQSFIFILNVDYCKYLSNPFLWSIIAISLLVTNAFHFQKSNTFLWSFNSDNLDHVQCTYWSGVMQFHDFFSDLQSKYGHFPELCWHSLGQYVPAVDRSRNQTLSLNLNNIWFLIVTSSTFYVLKSVFLFYFY